MSIGKIIKTGLAIYGGTVLAKKIGRYLFVKNKDKIAAWCKNKIVESCDKALDNIFHGDEKKDPVYLFHANDISFVNADCAFYAREKMIEAIHDLGRATVADLKRISFMQPTYEDTKWGWTDPDIFEAASIDRFKNDSTMDGHKYYVDVRHPDKLGDI